MQNGISCSFVFSTLGPSSGPGASPSPRDWTCHVSFVHFFISQPRYARSLPPPPPPPPPPPKIFFQTPIYRTFGYKGSTPLPVFFPPRRPRYYVHTSDQLQEFDLFTGAMISTIRTAVYDNKSITGLSCSFSKQGSTYIAASLETSATVIYDMNRKQYVATIPGFDQSVPNFMTTTQGGINPAAFVCQFGSSEMRVCAPLPPDA